MKSILSFLFDILELSKLIKAFKFTVEKGSKTLIVFFLIFWMFSSISKKVHSCEILPFEVLCALYISLCWLEGVLVEQPLDLSLTLGAYLTVCDFHWYGVSLTPLDLWLNSMILILLTRSGNNFFFLFKKKWCACVADKHLNMLQSVRIVLKEQKKEQKSQL